MSAVEMRFLFGGEGTDPAGVGVAGGTKEEEGVWTEEGEEEVDLEEVFTLKFCNLNMSAAVGPWLLDWCFGVLGECIVVA
mmetsp:Transcript_9973/g.20357  ORF Transcript_9973/g.20357 Transcript_9973/m.20357 type:complete len:80 (+) Transcript_9973:1337-1576(+)